MRASSGSVNRQKGTRRPVVTRSMPARLSRTTRTSSSAMCVKYPIARRMGVPIKLPAVSPQPHSHLAFEGFQFAKGHGRGNEYNHRVLEAFFVESRDIGDIGVLTKLAGEVGLDEGEFEESP